MLRHGRTAERSSPSPQAPVSGTLSPAVQRLWTAGLLAVLSLLFIGSRPAYGQAAIAVVKDADGVNLRAGPGTDYPSQAVVPKGVELPILGAKVNNDWIPVSYQGKTGFVKEEFVEVRAAGAAPSPAPSASPSPSATPAAAANSVRVNSPDGVNLRAGPGTDQRVLTVIPLNARLTVVMRSPDGRWAQVTYNSQSGWVDAQYLSPATDSAPSAPAVADAGGGKYIWPVTGRSITTYFGPTHLGVDVDQYPSGGNPVVAVAAGKVTFAGGNQCCSYGLYIKIEHRDGVETLYAHLQSIDVREGQDVAQGQPLGLSGNSGFSTGAHLHFEIHVGDSPVDPLSLLPRGAQSSPAPSPSASPAPSGSPSPSPSASPSPRPSPATPAVVPAPMAPAPAAPPATPAPSPRAP